jgi:hypothetical protein
MFWTSSYFLSLFLLSPVFQKSVRFTLGETEKVLETKIGAETRFRSGKPFAESCYFYNPFQRLRVNEFARNRVYA